jgi:hypothetical protein
MLHFRLEGEPLQLPAHAGYGDPHDPAVLRALGDHAVIRHRADAPAAATSADPGALAVLGAELAAHGDAGGWLPALLPSTARRRRFPAW